MTVTAAGLGIIPAAASSAAAACGDVGAPICAAGRERTPGEAAAMGEGVDGHIPSAAAAAATSATEEGESSTRCDGRHFWKSRDTTTVANTWTAAR